MIRSSMAIAATALCLATTNPVSGQSDVMRSADHDYRIVTVAEGLEHPWAIAFLPGGDMIVTERPGRLRIVRNGRLLPDPVPGVPDVLAEGQGGLLDVVPHPDFATNRLIYLSYSKPIGDGTTATTAIARGRFENDRLTNVEELFEANSQGRGHYGSRIAFDGDGHFFFSVGDRQVPPTGDLEAHPAQDPSNNHGTINRLNDDGSIPGDNPFANGGPGSPEVWSYGHRNPQGLVYDRATGNLWETEHGPQGGDELNLIRPGLNYGWPVVGYGVNYGRTGARIHESTSRPDMESPTHFWVPSIATSGLMLYTGDRFPGWRGSLFVGGMAGEQIARLTLDSTAVVAEETLVRGLGRVRDIRQGPDGYIYLAIDDRRDGLTPVVRLEPVAR